MVPLGSGAQREVEDVLLTRYACYLIAQNGDPRKPEIAFAQTYFALQTRKQELIEARLAEHERLRARSQLVASEKELSTVIFERLGEGQSFGRIRSAGDTALFGGRSTAEMKTQLGVPSSRPLADFLPTITIKAKDLANEMTTFQVRQRDLRTEGGIAHEHVANNREVRNALGARGIRPEELPAEEDAKKLERRLKADERKLLGPGLARDGEDAS
jgi:DNA-damage-inducible protein D